MDTPQRLEAAVARLDALVDWERRDRSPAMRRGLEPVRDLTHRLGDPQLRWRAVHVAGTKGKGTTSALIAAGLARAGVSVGLYTSPHVDRIEERVVVDGEPVGSDELAAALERVLDARETAVLEASAAMESTWFDVLTAAAFTVFAARGVAWAVVECGLGGRLDSTNVVRGEVCVVTNIDREHTAVLGDELAGIAREKAGILDAGSVLVTGVLRSPALAADEDPAVVIDAIAAELGVTVRRLGSEVTGPGATIEADNVVLARDALDALGELGVHGPRGDLVTGELLDPDTVTQARLPGRLERCAAQGVQVVIDGGHVPSSVARVLAELDAGPRPRPENGPGGSGDPGGRAPEGAGNRDVVVLALGRDKDAVGVLKTLQGHADTVVCTCLTTGPLRSATELAAMASDLELTAFAVEPPALALERALVRARETRGRVLVLGSFYLAGAVRAALGTGSVRGPADRPC